AIAKQPDERKGANAPKAPVGIAGNMLLALQAHEEGQEEHEKDFESLRRKPIEDVHRFRHGYHPGTVSSFRRLRGPALWRRRTLALQFLADGRQFTSARRVRFGIRHSKSFERIEDDPGNDQLGIPLVIGGYDVPRGHACACRAQTFLISLRVLLPVFPLLYVRHAEFPVLLRLIDAREKALSLLLLGQMQVELDDAGSIAGEVLLQPHDGAIAIEPDRLAMARGVGEAFAAEDFGVHANDEHLLVMRSIEDSDPAALGQIAGGAPEEIVLQLLGTGMFETEHLTALGVDTGHHMLDRAILSGGVHCLKNQQNGVAVRRIEKLLQRA